jgi:hypothetical protein
MSMAKKDKLPTNMLLGRFNDKLETKLRKKYELEPTVPIEINWCDDGSYAHEIIIGNTKGTFSYLNYFEVERLLIEIFKTKHIEVSFDETYWPNNEYEESFAKVKKKHKLGEEIRCGADLPPKALKDWMDICNQRSIVYIHELKKS